MSVIEEARNADLPSLFELFDEYDRPAEAPPSPSHARELLARIREQGGTVFVEREQTGAVIRGTCTTYVLQILTRSGRPFGRC